MKTLSATIIQCEARELLLYKYLGMSCFGPRDGEGNSFYIATIHDVEEWEDDCILIVEGFDNHAVVIPATEKLYVITAMG